MFSPQPLIQLLVLLLINVNVSESRDVTPPRYAVSLDEPASSRWLHVLKAPGHDYNASLHASIGVITENKLFKEAEKLKQMLFLDSLYLSGAQGRRSTAEL